MQNIYKLISFILLSIVLSGCGSKYISTQTLRPSYADIYMKDIIVEEFNNDFISQAELIKEKLINNYVANQKTYNLKTNYNSIDSIITGDVYPNLKVESYSKEKDDNPICIRHIYDKKTKTYNCIKYIKRKIYCEKRDYELKTTVEIINKKGDIKFNKTYETSSYDDECYDNIPYNSYYVNRSFIQRDEDRIFNEMAKEIADDFLLDVSAHYINYKIYLIEELDESLNYTDEDRQVYEEIIEKIDGGNYYNINNKLEELNKKYNFKSHEILHTIGTIYEKENRFLEAIKTYNKSLEVCNNADNSELILKAIQRVKRNNNLKNKAIMQLK